MDLINKYSENFRDFLKNSLKAFLAFTARLFLKKYRPLVIGITGSVGKTSTKEAIYTALRKEKKTRRNYANFNSEFGFPLTILGDYRRSGSWFFWLRVLLKAWFELGLPKFITRSLFGGYPEVLVLEYGADKPGDIKHLIGIAKPEIGVITAIGDVPVHVEFYDNPKQVAKEKARLIKSLESSNQAILNADEKSVKELEKKTKAVVSTFGFSDGVDIKISDFETELESAGRGLPKKPMGIAFRLESGENFAPIRIAGTLGKSQAYAVAAAAAVGLRLGLSLMDIADAFTYFQVPNQRVNLAAGHSGSYIIDDSYNASPIAMSLALETLSEVKAKRKIAVLGDMLELGSFSNKAHRDIGRLAAKTVDILITVGKEAKKIASSAKEAEMPAKNIFRFENAEEAEEKLLEIAKKGDLILIKGSKAIGLKKVAEALRIGKIVK